MKDKFLLGSLAGIAGAMVMVIANLLLNLIPGVSQKLLFAVTQMFVLPAMVNTFNGQVIAVLANLACGGLLGLIFTYLISFTYPKYILVKGLIFGSGAWFLMCGMVARALNLPMVSKPLDQYINVAVHLIYGTVIAYIISKFGVFEKAPAAKEKRL